MENDAIYDGVYNPWLEYERRKAALWDEPLTDMEYFEEIERILDDLGL